MCLSVPDHRYFLGLSNLHPNGPPDPQRFAGVDRVRDSWADPHMIWHLQVWFDSCVQRMDCRSQMAGRRRRLPCVAFRAVAAGCLFGSLCCTGVKAFVPRHTSAATTRRYVVWAVTTNYPDTQTVCISCVERPFHEVLCLNTVEQGHVRDLFSRQ